MIREEGPFTVNQNGGTNEYCMHYKRSFFFFFYPESGGTITMNHQPHKDYSKGIMEIRITAFSDGVFLGGLFSCPFYLCLFFSLPLEG